MQICPIYYNIFSKPPLCMRLTFSQKLKYVSLKAKVTQAFWGLLFWLSRALASQSFVWLKIMWIFFEAKVYMFWIHYCSFSKFLSIKPTEQKRLSCYCEGLTDCFFDCLPCSRSWSKWFWSCLVCFCFANLRNTERRRGAYFHICNFANFWWSNH